MRESIAVLALVLIAVPALAEGEEFESRHYKIRATGPEGWKRTVDEPKPRGTWLDLVRYEEEKTGAEMTLSVQASSFATGDAMIRWQRERFRKDASIAVLRDEVRRGGGRRPDGVFFEYTYQHQGKARHAIAAYWLYSGRRYRVYATVREAGWRAASRDMEDFVASVEFTGRLFSERKQNWTDEALNYAIYFPEGWTVLLPEGGPRAVFKSHRLGVSIWLYVEEGDPGLEEGVERTFRELEKKGARITKRGESRKHPALGREVREFEYTRTIDGNRYRYGETAIFHRDRFYRIVLAAADSAFSRGREAYERVVESISFMK